MEVAVDPEVVYAVENDLYKPDKFKKPKVSSKPVNTTNLAATLKSHTPNMSYVHTTNMSYLYNRRKEHIEKNMCMDTHTISGDNVFLENEGT